MATHTDESFISLPPSADSDSIPYSQHSTRCMIISEDFQADLFVEVGKTALLMEITSLGGRVFVRAEAYLRLAVYIV